MTLYPGNKSLDAEIRIDFSSNDIEMDYTLNKQGSIYSSNDSVRLKDEYRALPFRERFIISIKKFPIFLFSIGYNVLLVPLLTWAFHKGLIKNKNYQIEHQRIMRDLIISLIGIKKTEISGPYQYKEIIIPINNNIWVGYTLEGDYQTEIKAISLKRRFVTGIKHGKEWIKQRGWNVILEFRNPPEFGKCVIEYL